MAIQVFDIYPWSNLNSLWDVNTYANIDEGRSGALDGDGVYCKAIEGDEDEEQKWDCSDAPSWAWRVERLQVTVLASYHNAGSAKDLDVRLDAQGLTAWHTFDLLADNDGELKVQTFDYTLASNGGYWSRQDIDFLGINCRVSDALGKDDQVLLDFIFVRAFILRTSVGGGVDFI